MRKGDIKAEAERSPPNRADLASVQFMRFGRRRITASNALMRIMRVVHVTTVRVDELKLLNFSVHECLHRYGIFAEFDL